MDECKVVLFALEMKNQRSLMTSDTGNQYFTKTSYILKFKYFLRYYFHGRVEI